MYHALYSEMAADTTQTIRENEKLAFERSISLLKVAKARGRGSKESVEALLFHSRLWTVLLEDLASEENGLPDSLKAKLISIGIWMLRRSEDIRQGVEHDFTPLIEISEAIKAGLGRR